MQKDLVVKGRNLGGSSDLTLLAPIKPGFIPALESVSYKTRIKRVLETLHGARQASHEFANARLLSDSIERVGAILSVRVAVLEPENKVLLAVSFDGSWESYIRILWAKVGTLLDVIFCSTEGYVTAFDHGFEEWLGWARTVQVETGFYYAPPDFSARDVLYQRRTERMRQRGSASELSELRTVLPTAEDTVKRLTSAQTSDLADEPPYVWAGQPFEVRRRMVRERMRIGLKSLSALYRLAEMFPPITLKTGTQAEKADVIRDARVMRLASVDLLREFIQLKQLAPDEWSEQSLGNGSTEGRFKRQMQWLSHADEIKATPPSPVWPPRPDGFKSVNTADVQGGILEAYSNFTHGVCLLITFDSTQCAKSFLKNWAVKVVTAASAEHDASKTKKPFVNMALTAAGLRAAGLTEDEITTFPEEFRQGMAARAGILGDVRHNHPRRWRIPKRLSGLNGQTAHTSLPEIELDSVHAMVTLRCHAPQCPGFIDFPDKNHPLHAFVDKLLADYPGLTLLAAQSLVRLDNDHFGFADGLSQPEFNPEKSQNRRNLVHVGEALQGYENSADEAPPVNDTDGKPSWTKNGSFLVVRKYRQFAYRMEKAVKRAAEPLEDEMDAQAARELVYAKLMGRWRDGAKLIGSLDENGNRVEEDPSKRNNFSYQEDPQGTQCPLHAHIRLANPRPDHDGPSRFPRIVRRGMSYGPMHTLGNDDDHEDRGLLFMAYNADISEQFEVIQRWLTGGNSTGSTSGQSCPVLGVPENGFPRHFRFEHKANPDDDDDDTLHVVRVQLEENTPVFDDPKVLTQLEWGMYLFAPSLSMLKRLGGRPFPKAAEVAWDIEAGEKQIQALLRLSLTTAEEAELALLSQDGEATLSPRQRELSDRKNAAIAGWKMAIEDPVAIDRLESASLWAAIRQNHGGVLKTPYGLLVASRECLHQVFNQVDDFSVKGQMDRMALCFGKIALGMDAGKIYDEESKPINDAIMNLTATQKKREAIFWIAFDAATQKIETIVKDAADSADGQQFEATLDVRDVFDEVLADLAEHWFGLQGSEFLQRGGGDFNWKPSENPRYPGHFTALSRYMFQPNPGPVPIQQGQEYGNALRTHMRKFVKHWRDAGSLPKAPDGSDAPVSKAIFEHPKGRGLGDNDRNDFIARNIVGVLMGFNPTIIGALINVVREWQRDGKFGLLRSELGCWPDVKNQTPGSRTSLYQSAHRLIHSAMTAANHMRPMPQIAWRTAKEGATLCPAHGNSISIDANQTVVLALVSGTQESLADGKPDGLLMFGGQRRAGPHTRKSGTGELKQHPTHACPGYEAGIEAMTGTLAAILSRNETVRQGLGWLNFSLEGPIDATATAPSTKGTPDTVGIAKKLWVGAKEAAIKAERKIKKQRNRVLQDGRELALKVERQFALGEDLLFRPPNTVSNRLEKRKGMLLCWGDSWFDYTLVVNLGTDLRDSLERFGYTVPAKYCNWNTWPTAAAMAADTSGFCNFVVDQIENSATPPLAIVISAGGNDSVGNRLEIMLKAKEDITQDPESYFISEALNDLMFELESHYRTVITTIAKAVELAAPTKTVPLLLHGYDHPYPAHPRGLPKWMHDPFKNKNYLLDDPTDAAAAHQAMVELIDRFNGMLKNLAVKSSSVTVHYVDLRGTIGDIEGWNDAMHPTTESFANLAAKLDDAIQTIHAKP